MKAQIDKTPRRVMSGIVQLVDTRPDHVEKYQAAWNVVVSYTGKTTFEICHWQADPRGFFDCEAVPLDQEAAKTLLAAISRE